MEQGLDTLNPTVERTVDESDSEELPVSYGCVTETVPEVLTRKPVRVRDNADESAPLLEVLDNTLDAFFKELWAGRDIMKRKVVTDDVKRPTGYGAYITNLKNRSQTHRLCSFPSFRNRRDIWIETDQLASGPLLEVAAAAAPTVQDEIARLDVLLNKLPFE